MKFDKLIKQEVEYYIEWCNFTEDELEAFKLLSRGFSRIQISDRLCVSMSTVGRLKKSIEAKVEKVKGEEVMLK